MKKIVTLISVFAFVLFLSTGAFAQGKGGGHGQGHGPEVSHGGDHGKAENQQAHEGHKDANFEQRIEQNPALKAKLQSMLPAGTDLKTAASGFRNQGQFIAALHVSKNLGIPFDQLKAKMLGTTAATGTTATTASTAPMSLGKAILALKPGMSAKDAEAAADEAEKEAKLTVSKPTT
jgi:hypothetical protein